MKIKILALIMAVFCLSTVLAGCADKTCDKHVDENQDGKCDNCDFQFCSVHKDNDANLECDECGLTLPKCDVHKDEAVDNVCDVCKLPIPVKCDVHKDENADKICDACGGAIVVITEQIAPSTDAKVDMVVNPIPDNVNLGDYIVVDKEEEGIFTEIDKVNMNNIYTFNDKVWVQTFYDEDEGVTTYEVYDFINHKSIFKTSTATNSSDTYKDISINLGEHYFVVTVIEYGRYSYVRENASVAYYDYTGNTTLTGAKWDSYSEEAWDSIVNSLIPTFAEINGVDYVAFGNDVYAFEPVTSELLGKFDDRELVYRPAFDDVAEDKYGYVEKDGKIFVYDLNKWIECVYTYEIPVSYDEYDWFVLENGNVLVQGIEFVADKKVNYDYTESGAKFDMIYTVIDPSAKSEKNVEFGYRILAVTEAHESFTEKAQNLAVIFPVVSDIISDDYKVVILNNDLTIAADITEAIEYELVADELFKKTENVGGVEKTTIVDINGNEVAYVPYSASVNEKFISYDGKIYNFKMKELMDLEDEEFQVYYECDSYMILTKYDTANYRYVYYYYDMESESAKKISGQDNANFNIEVYEFGYIVSFSDMGDREYKFYNVNGESVGNFDDGIVDIRVYGDCMVFYLLSGEYYIVK